MAGGLRALIGRPRPFRPASRLGGKMNHDIRIDISFATHRKRKKLFNVLGAQGVLSLIDLWLATAENRPKGILTGMSDGDIALDAQWEGDPAEFCQALVEVGFLDRAEDGVYSIHDWRDHQPYAFFAEDRSAQAKAAAQARWGRNADSMRGACGQHAEGNAPSPIPNPFPSPKEKDPSAIFEKIAGLVLKLFPGEKKSELFAPVIEALSSTRKSGKISPSVILTQLKKWASRPVEQIHGGIKTYLAKGYAAQGKGEAYLWGIIRNAKAQEPSSKSTGSRLLDAYYRQQGEARK